MSSDNADKTLLNMALAGIKEGRFTIDEAEKVFGLKIPREIYPTKEVGFYIDNKTPDYYGWAKYFIDNNKFFSFDGGYYIYDNEKTMYRRISEAEIDYRLTQDTMSKARPQDRNGFIRTLTSSSFKVPSEMTQIEGYLNLKNGTLDVKAGKLRPHDSNLFFTYCLPHNYEPSAKCDRWMKFLNDIFSGTEEMKIVASMIFGYVLLGGHPWLHQAYVLYGEGRNGKSTFLEILKYLIGYDNYSSVSLSKLNLPFSVIHLDNKLANIIEETPNDKINAEAFKTAIGGGHLQGSRKYENEYLFACQARFIFACNELPKFSEQSVGLQERLYFIPFKTYFEESNRNGNILNELKAELPGILNWALNGLNLLLDERRIPKTQASTEVLEQFKIESDSVHAWADEYLIFDADSKVETKARDLYRSYASDMNGTGRHTVSDMTFFKRLKKYLKTKKGFKNEFFLQRNSTYIGVYKINNASNQVALKIPNYYNN